MPSGFASSRRRSVAAASAMKRAPRSATKAGEAWRWRSDMSHGAAYTRRAMLSASCLYVAIASATSRPAAASASAPAAPVTGMRSEPLASSPAAPCAAKKAVRAKW
jgi:hypothetical protein